MEQILYLFHHIHHVGKKHEVHHCGGKHKRLDYNIKHCGYRMHSIDKKSSFGHDFGNRMVEVKFFEKCPDGGWHIESGEVDI